MPEVISNTSPVKYLHQVGLLDLLPQLVRRVTLPQAVVDELESGRALGYDLPDVASLGWVSVRAPAGPPRVFSPDLGRGETDVLRLALESAAGDLTLILGDVRVLSRREARAIAREPSRHQEKQQPTRPPGR